MNDLTTPMSYPQLPHQPRQSPISQPFPQPMTMYPPPQMPPPPMPPPPMPPPKRRARTVLAIACGLAFAAAAVFGWLYVSADGEHDTAIARLDQRQGELAVVRSQLGDAEKTKSSAQERNDGLESENATLTTCVEAVQHYLWDGLEGAPRTTAFNAMYDACQ